MHAVVAVTDVCTVVCVTCVCVWLGAVWVERGRCGWRGGGVGGEGASG